MNKEEITKRIAEIEKEEAKLYKNRKEMSEAESFKWYMANIKPLDEERKHLENELYKMELLAVKVGDGVTIGCWTDRYAYTVISRTAKTITIQRDKAIRTDNNGMSECQDYKYERNKNGDVKTFRWSEKKGWICGSYRLSLGRHEYFDYSF